MSSLRYLERGFQGVDRYVAPSELTTGFLTQCDNLRVDGGDLVPRPGLQGLLTTPHTAPVYGLFAHIKADGATELLYSAAMSGQGRVWRLPVARGMEDSAASAFHTAAEVLFGTDHFDLNPSGVFFERAGSYVYGIDGEHDLFRIDDDSVGSAVAGLSASASPVAASLYFHVIDPFDTLSGSPWTASALPSGAANNQLPDTGLFTTWSNPDVPGGGWTPDNVDGTIDFELVPLDTDGNGTPDTKFLRMDDNGSKFHLTTPISNVAYTGTTSYARQFRMRAYYKATRLSDTIGITVTVYDTSGNFLADSRQQFTATAINQILPWEYVFSFADLDTPIHSYQVTYNTVSGSVGTPGDGPYLGKLFLAPVDPSVTFTLSGGHVGVSAPVTSGQAALGGVHLTKDLGAETDFSGVSHLSLGYKAVSTFEGFAANIGLRKSSAAGGTIVYSNPVTIAADGKSLNVDISTLSENDRTAIQYVEIVLTGSLLVTASASVLFTLGPLVSAGNLTVGRADYQWLYTEVNNGGYAVASDDLTNLLESNPSPYSASITPTETQAMGQLTLPAKTNASAATHFRIYRLGGVFSDGLARLVGTWAFGTGGPSVDNPDRLAVYDSTAGIVYDNVPDHDLLGETTVADFGRNTAPTGAQAICFYQGRLGLGVISQFYWSWLVDSDGAAGLYFNTFLDPGDPNAAIKGGLYPIGGNDNDPITRFDPFASQLVIEKSRSVWLGVGSDALDLRVQQYLSSQGVGCVAKRGGGKVGNHVWMRGADSLYQFDADTVDDVGTNIERSLNPAAQDDAFVYHGRRGFWITRSPGASANDAAWVWDTRTEQYVRFLQFAVTGGVSLAAGENGDGAYFGGLDGQVYQLTGSADRATPTATPTAISWAVTTRAFGAETGREVTGTHVLCEVSVQQATTFTLTASEDGGTGRSASVPYSVSGAGEYRLRLRLPPGKARGRALTVTVAGASTLPLRLQAVGLEAVTGARA